MKKISSADNTRLFKEAEILRKSIQADLHCKARNLKSSLEPAPKSSNLSQLIHEKLSKKRIVKQRRGKLVLTSSES